MKPVEIYKEKHGGGDIVAKHITFEDIAQFPRPGGRTPTQFKFSEDGQTLYYLYPDDGDRLSVWAFDLASSTHLLVTEPPADPGADTFDEEMRRQRARFSWSGIGRYEWRNGRLLIPLHGHLYTMTAGESGLRLVPNAEDIVDARLSRDGQRIFGVKDNNLCVIDVGTGTATWLTEAAQEGVSYGLAEYAAQEELDRSRGYWVSPDETFVALTEVDERHIPEYLIVHSAADPVRTEKHRYPFVGAANARVRLGVRPVEGEGAIRWLDWGPEERYLLDVLWTESQQIWVLTLSRDHQHLAWDRYSVQGEKLGRLYEETATRWINRPHASFVVSEDTLISTTERDGLRRLLVVTGEGVWKTLANPGETAVQDVLAVDDGARVAFVSATRRRALERTLVAIAWDDGHWEDLTPEPGSHPFVTAAPRGTAFVDLWSDLDHAPETRLLTRTPAGLKSTVIKAREVSREALGLTRPEFFEVTVEDGTILNGLAYVPEGSAPAGGWPLVVSVYAGPHAQMVMNDWNETIDLMSQYLVQHGFLVIKVDSRGSFNRGPDFEGVLYRHFGDVELADQVAGVERAGALWPVNRDRVGIHGWSYGGYMTLRALLMAPQVFSVGVSGAPVSDFRWYDTAYTERYLGTDETNHAGYESTSLVNKADRLEGKLLLIHGMVDENVHFRHSAAMIQAFIDADRDFDLVVLPHSRHMVQGRANTHYRIRRTLEYFEKNL